MADDNTSVIFESPEKTPFIASTNLVLPSDSTSDLGSDVGNHSYDELEENVDYAGTSPVSPSERSPLLRHVILHAVSSQLERLKDRATLGRPTAIAVSSFLAVGTSTSVVLIFDSKQILKCCLADRRINDYGAVSCLSFSVSGDRLVAGHARGHIVLWDTIAARMLVSTDDFHLLDCPILHVSFSAFQHIAVASDASGSVFALSFTGSSSSCLSRLLFSGARGEALYFDVLSPASVQHCIKRLPFVDSVVVVIVTVGSAIVSSFSPSTGSIHKLLRVEMSSNDPTSPPVSCWCPTVTPIGGFEELQAFRDHQYSSKRYDPFVFRLCVGRGSRLSYFLLKGSKSAASLTASPLTEVSCRSLDIPSDILWACWPKADFQLVFDADERLHIISTATITDAKSIPTRVNSIDLSGAGIVYASGAFFKATATGSSVSQAMSSVGDRACYSSLAGSNGQLFLLGTSGVHVLTPRALYDRVKQLLECGERNAAFSVLLNAHRGPTAIRPVWLDDTLIDILFEYAAIPPKEVQPNDLAAVDELVPICLNKLFSMSDLFSSLASSIESSAIRLLVVNKVLEFIHKGSSPSSDTLSDAKVNGVGEPNSSSIPPQVVEMVFDTLSVEPRRFDDLSRFLCLVEITSLDLNRAIRFTRKHHLYMPYIRLYWEALADWRTPLVTLLDAIVVAYFKSLNMGEAGQILRKSGTITSLASSSSISPSSLSPAQMASNDNDATVTVLLDFLECLLARLYYPSRKMCPYFTENDRLEAFDVLCARLPSSAIAAEFPIAVDESSGAGLRSPSTYAYLKVLLIASPDRVLSVLSAVLDSASAASTDSLDSAWNSRRQLLVDIVFEILESIDKSEEAATEPLDTSQISDDLSASPQTQDEFTNVRLACYTFAVQEISVSIGRPARLFGETFQRMVRGLFDARGDQRAEAALFVIFRADLFKDYCSDAELLAMAEQGCFYDLAAAVCLRHGWRARMLRYYFSVPSWLPRVFDFLTESFTTSDLPDAVAKEDSRAVLDVCVTYADKIVAADPVRASRFVSDYLWDDDKRRDAFLQQLRQSKPAWLLFVLLLKIRRDLNVSLLVERVALAAEIEYEQVALHLPSAINADPTLKNSEVVHDDVEEDDDSIDNCVRTVPSSMLEHCLTACADKRRKAFDHVPKRTQASFFGSSGIGASFAEALILINTGRANDAIVAALQTIKIWLCLAINDSSSGFLAHKLDVSVRRLLRLVSKAKAGDAKKNFDVPLHLLGDIFCALESEPSSPQFSTVISALCSIFSPATIIDAVLRSPSEVSSRPQPRLGAIRRLLSTVFSLNEDEISSYSSMQGIYSDEMESSYRHFRIAASRGIRLNSAALRCCICKRSPDQDQVLIFCCDHIAHSTCCNSTPVSMDKNHANTSCSQTTSRHRLHEQKSATTSSKAEQLSCPLCQLPQTQNTFLTRR